MPRYIAFLRGINVGGHIVKMQTLRRLFESHGFSGVETVIASGNVVFESSQDGTRKLEQEIEGLLAQALGYHVATFLRTVPELAAVARRQPFGPEDIGTDATIYVVFLRDKPKPAVQRALRTLTTENDALHVGKREVYWLRRAKLKESDRFGALLAKTLGDETTIRNITTVQKIANKYR